jgi:glycosyltransferase involved in cell wall biosynthesis
MKSSEVSSIRFSIITPAYNRGHLLPRLYQSVLAQTYQPYEFIVVDDGSSDNTAQVVDAMIRENRLNIKYIRKPNGGMHTAVNAGALAASGDMVVVSDSDDYFVPTALERMAFHWAQIPAERRAAFLGICGLFKFENGDLVGSRFPEDIFDSDAIDLKYRHKISGDKIGCILTGIMQAHPHPEEYRYVRNSIAWTRMALKYQTRYVNEIFAVKEYLANGQTDKRRLIDVQNARSSLLGIAELINSRRTFDLMDSYKFYANYIRYSLDGGVKMSDQVRHLPNKLLYALSLPTGVLLSWRDKKYLKRKQSASVA